MSFLKNPIIIKHLCLINRCKRKISKFLFVLKYIGISYYCPFCKMHFSHLLPMGENNIVLKKLAVIGGGYRLEAKCPNCNSLDRDRLIYLYLKNYQKQLFVKSLKILHIAPEYCLKKWLKSYKNIDYISADLSSPISDIHMDITNIPYPNENWEVIICNHVLEHINDDLLAMSELYRILKRGGFAILQVPISNVLTKTYEDFSITDSDKREIAFGQRDHVRIYGRDYIERLESIGFKVELFDYSKCFSNHIIKKYSLIKDDIVFVCHKQ